jgi:hypothetical protein
MAKQRPSLPKAVREAVLTEFSHRCAMCGADRPQLHHIDGNPSHNETDNLIPLCPSCHLVDQHNPTQPIDPEKLRLFRRFKDPTILRPEFDPLFRRALFLIQLVNAPFDVESVRHSVEELVAFVTALKMGEFYGKKLHTLLDKPPLIYMWTSDTPESEFHRQRVEEEQAFRQKLLANREASISLLIELLRYQGWAHVATKPTPRA